MYFRWRYPGELSHVFFVAISIIMVGICLVGEAQAQSRSSNCGPGSRREVTYNTAGAAIGWTCVRIESEVPATQPPKCPNGELRNGYGGCDEQSTIQASRPKSQGGARRTPSPSKNPAAEQAVTTASGAASSFGGDDDSGDTVQAEIGTSSGSEHLNATAAQEAAAIQSSENLVPFDAPTTSPGTWGGDFQNDAAATQWNSGSDLPTGGTTTASSTSTPAGAADDICSEPVQLPNGGSAASWLMERKITTKFQALCQARQQFLARTFTASDPVVGPAIVAARTKVIEATQRCAAAASQARKVCAESLTNPYAIAAFKYGQEANMIVKMLAGNSRQMCTDLGKVQQALNLGLTSWHAACGAMRVRAGGTCSSSLTELQQASADVVKAVNASTNPSASMAVATDFTQASASVQTAVTGVHSAVGSYGETLLKLGVGVAQGLMSLTTMNNCKKDLASPNVPQIAGQPPDPLDCRKPEHANTTQCICAANPRSPGCGNATGITGNGGGGTTSGSVSSNPTGTTPIPNLQGLAGGGGPNGGAGSNPNAAGFSSGGAGAGGGGGGGSVGGGGGTLGKAGDAAKAKAGRSGTNPNINSGDLSGGGGGGRGGSGWGGSSTDAHLAAAQKKYGQFMPGGNQDPSRNPASTQVSGAGGLSNFEKVRLRYQQQASTLSGL